MLLVIRQGGGTSFSCTCSATCNPHSHVHSLSYTSLPFPATTAGITPFIFRTFCLDFPGTWDCRRVLSNVLRVEWLDVLEHHGWAVRAACSQEDPATLLKGIETDLVIHTSLVDQAPFDGECANFLLFKGEGEPRHPFPSLWYCSSYHRTWAVASDENRGNAFFWGSLSTALRENSSACGLQHAVASRRSASFA